MVARVMPFTRLRYLAVFLLMGASGRCGEISPPARPSKSPVEVAILEALSRDPATAVYAIDTSVRRGRVVLRGRVGTHAVHQAAVQTALQVTPSIDDELVIDTAEVFRAMPARVQSGAVAVGMVPGGFAGPIQTAGWLGAPPGYVYPPPLFGRIDDPFFGFEPPVISFPPWWGQLTAARRAEMTRAARIAEPAPDRVAELEDGTGESLEMDVDADGVATVRGRVASEEAKQAVLNELRRTPGIGRIVDQIEVDGGEGAAGERPGPAAERVVPPPPAPGNPFADLPPAAVPPPAPVLKSRADVRIVDGVALLSGRVEGIVEAMHAYLDAERNPGVRAIEDRLEFPPPDERRNPLLAVEPREDVVKYLDAQLRRHLGSSAAVDSVEFEGDSLVVRGTVADTAAQARALAIVRTMAILRGLEVESDFTALRK